MTETVELQPVEVHIRVMLTPSRALDDFLADLERRKYATRTVKRYGDTIGQFVDELPDGLDVSQITLDHLREHFAGYRHLARGTIATNESAFARWFGWLYENDRITRNPIDKLARTRRVASEDLDVTTISVDDVRRLLFACDTWAERLCLSVLAYLGPRRHALALLRISDYDRARGRIRFKEKRGKTIWKPVPDELDQLIEQAIAAGVYTDTDYLIPPEGPLMRKGDRDDRCIWRIVKKVAARAGVEAHVHALRAAFACFYLESNPGDVKGLKELMGHRSIATTEVYLRMHERARDMEPVRGLSWAVDESYPHIASGGRNDEEPEPASYVYFIAAGDWMIDGTPIKIGFSGDPHERLRKLQVNHPAPLRLIASFVGTLRDEHALHEKFADERLLGEWFSSNQAIRAVIARRGNAPIATGQQSAGNRFAEPRLMGAGGFEPPLREPRLPMWEGREPNGGDT